MFLKVDNEFSDPTIQEDTPWEDCAFVFMEKVGTWNPRPLPVIQGRLQVIAPELVRAHISRLSLACGLLTRPSTICRRSLTCLLEGDGEASSKITHSVANSNVPVTTRYGGCLTQRDHSTVRQRRSTTKDECYVRHFMSGHGPVEEILVPHSLLACMYNESLLHLRSQFILIALHAPTVPIQYSQNPELTPRCFDQFDENF